MAIGGCTVEELQSRMSYGEFLDWIAFYELHPFGMENWNAGVIASTIANAHRDPKKQKKPFTPSDFMPKVDTDKPSGDWQTMKAKFQQLGAASKRRK